MFNFGGGGAFGSSQSQPSAFGSMPTTPTPFGATTPFGSQPSPFGASQPAFGASQPAFGMSTPAFGASSASTFGSNAFGARPAAPSFGGFGSTSSSSPFGASMPAFGASTPAFGATSAPAFGLASTPAFGATSAPAFGATSTPAFGATSTFGAASSPFGGGLSTSFGASPTPAFGQPASSPGLFGGTGAFGATSAPAFGASSSPAFGAGAASPFGAQPGVAGQGGTRITPYVKQMERDTSTAGANTSVYFTSISAMPAYNTKSVEELRWEDYQQGVKGGTGAVSSPAFGGATFGAASGAAPVFGAAPATSSPFGTPSPSSTPAFSFGGASSASPFGASSSPAFGSTGGGIFGASSAAASPFGASSASTSVFGSGLTPSNPFGGTSAFGVTASASTPSPTPGFGSSSPSIFGSTPSPQSGAFGAFGATSSPAFGATTSPGLFGASSSPGLFGASSASTFGQTATGPFSFNTQSKAAFGQSTPAPSTGGGLFGNPTSTFGGFGASTGGGFGVTSQTASPSPFATPAPTGGLFGSSTPAFGAVTPFGGAAATPAQPPPVNQVPYGQLSALPTVSVPVPENKVGISQRPTNSRMTSGAVTLSRHSPLLRTQIFRATPFSSRSRPYNSPLIAKPSPPPSMALSLYQGPQTPGLSSLSGALIAGGAAGPSPMLPTRENPHNLFIRELPPTTDSAGVSGLTPAKGGPRRLSSDEGMRGTGGSPSPRPSAPPLTPTPAGPIAGPAANGAAANGAAASAPTGAQPSNGRGPRADAHPSAPSVLPTLGRLVADGYAMAPSRTQLQAMYDTDPDSLAAVHGFTVSRAGFGEIRWLESVDVRGLDLSEVVTIDRGEASVYLHQEDKPPQGQGLNCRSEVTLEGVYKMDKSTNTPVKDGPAVIQYEKRLRKHCNAIDAKFIAYKPQGGCWKFEVAHWSKYGIPDDSGDDEDTDFGREDSGSAGVMEEDREEVEQLSTSGADATAAGAARTPMAHRRQHVL